MTVAALIAVTTRAPLDQNLLQRYNVSIGKVQHAYLLILTLTVLIWSLENQIRNYLQGRKSAFVLVLLLAIAAFALLWSINLVQEARTFQFPLTLWIIIIHGVGLCALTVATFIDGDDPPMIRLAEGVVAGCGALLLLAHISSIGEFARLDIPDEPLVTSMATNYAENNQLSPSFIGSPYGTPDPSLGRYFLLMGLWLKATGDSYSVANLRAFSLLVGAAGTIIFAYTLWRIPDLTRLQRLAGLVTFLALSTVVRSTHNMRMDAGLIVYGPLVLLGLVLFEQHHQKRWLVLTGLAFFVGLQSVPTTALVMAGAVGLVLFVRFFRQPAHWIVYGLACTAAILAFYIGQFLPNIADGYAGYQRFTEFYVEYGGLSSLSSDPAQLVTRQLQNLFDYLIRFNIALSPVEGVFIIGALVYLARRNAVFDHNLAWICALTALLLLTVILSSYNYWVLFAPFIAYGIARLCEVKRLTVVGSFVLIPALVSAPIYDMVTAVHQRPNHQQIVAAEAISEMFPEGITLVGESLFWFTLHQNRNYIHWSGIVRLMLAQEKTWEEVMVDLNVDMAICWSQENNCRRTINIGLFDEPQEVVVNGERYWVFRRANS